MSGGNLTGNVTLPHAVYFYNKTTNPHGEVANYGGGETTVGTFDRTNQNKKRYITVRDNTITGEIGEALGFIDYDGNIFHSYLLFGEHNIDTLVSSLGGRVELVTYAGTGTYGKSNPCSVTFSFAPKLIMMIGYTFNNHPSSSLPDGLFNAVTTSYTNHIACEYLTTKYKESLGLIQDTAEERSYGKKSSDGKTIYWYTTGSWQYNDAGFKYYVLGIA